MHFNNSAHGGKNRERLRRRNKRKSTHRDHHAHHALRTLPYGLYHRLMLKLAGNVISETYPSNLREGKLTNQKLKARIQVKSVGNLK